VERVNKEVLMNSTRYGELAECTAEDVQEEYTCDCPAVDIREENDRYILEANLPGLSEKDVEVRVEDNYLTLSSRITSEKTEGGIKYLMRERGESFFERSFILPKDSDREKIEAHFKNGVLTLSIGRAEALKPRLIDVKPD
jgi:HSP20 family protein